MLNLYSTQEEIGSGSFGKVFMGCDNETGERVAIKTEPLTAKIPQLHLESKLYKMLRGCNGVPKLRWYGYMNGVNAMVTDLLGPNLEHLFCFCNRIFTLKTVLMLGVQILQVLENVHSRGVIHRDLKPENILMGIGDHANAVYLVDFGLGKLFYNTTSCQHIPMKTGKSLIGTARYTSINMHLGIEPSRRDDLEALGYILVYFLKGRLPWQGLQDTTGKKRHAAIGEMKINTSLDILCDTLPHEIIDYIKYCRDLKFTEVPDYKYLRGLFKNVMKRKGLLWDYKYSWTMRKKCNKSENDAKNKTI